MNSDKLNLPAADEPLQKLMREIMLSMIEKITRPVLDETRRLGQEIQKLQEGQSQTRALLDSLAGQIRENPLLVLAALRDAIQRAERE
ncbi:hypothetical protein [Desulfotomaculum copahuensis]|uniref:Uncharacterized protein n=1 Tax=Desulfotomaculum copahuensis TaxID=1838280 RepID=A0A1B7LDL7_9FIRM|nr:hypothetical protein [Desulfotomaculum copahuensis]OAT81189.1 hypothetical protein A6M21_11685 [Desulfotomaculum copahuensis]